MGLEFKKKKYLPIVRVFSRFHVEPVWTYQGNSSPLWHLPLAYFPLMEVAPSTCHQRSITRIISSNIRALTLDTGSIYPFHSFIFLFFVFRYSIVVVQVISLFDLFLLVLSIHFFRFCFGILLSFVSIFLCSGYIIKNKCSTKKKLFCFSVLVLQAQIRIKKKSAIQKNAFVLVF